jgi:hypothetical protein
MQALGKPDLEGHEYRAASRCQFVKVQGVGLYSFMRENNKKLCFLFGSNFISISSILATGELSLP